MIEEALNLLILNAISKNSTRLFAEEKGHGIYYLEMHKAYIRLGYGSILMSVFCVFGFLYSFGFNVQGLLWSFVVGGIFAGLGIFCVLLYRNHKAIIYDKGVEVTNFLGNVKSMKWEEMKKVRFSGLSWMLGIKSEKVRIRISIQLVGFATFIELLERHTEWTAESIKMPVNDIRRREEPTKF